MNTRLQPNDRSPAVAHGALLPSDEAATPQVRRLMEVATAAFAERGYHGVSVRDLASAVGIKAGSFYSHFPSKEQLLFELVSLGHRAHQATVRDALLSAGADPAEQLREAIRANVRFHGTYPLLAIVANAELHALSDEHRDTVLDIRHASGVLLSAAIERGNELGVFGCEDTWLAMAAIGAMGIRVAWWFRPIGTTDETPLDMYPAEATHWFPKGEYTLDQIADSYAEYAIKIVSRAT